MFEDVKAINDPRSIYAGYCPNCYLLPILLYCGEKDINLNPIV
jgi:hypothetical protein